MQTQASSRQIDENRLYMFCRGLDHAGHHSDIENIRVSIAKTQGELVNQRIDLEKRVKELERKTRDLQHFVFALTLCVILLAWRVW